MVLAGVFYVGEPMIYGEIVAAFIACALLWATLNIDLLLGKRNKK